MEDEPEVKAERDRINKVLDKRLPSIIQGLADRFGREPTEDEVYDFIFGSSAKQLTIWNTEVKA